MAKRVVVFDTQEAPSVIVRRSRTNKNTAKKVAPPPKKSTTPPKKRVSKKPHLDDKTIFRDRLLADMRHALDNARKLKSDETRLDQNYYSEKAEFLENAIKALNSEECSFAPLSEPFFWNEFKRITALIFKGPKVENRISKTWRKAGMEMADVLTKHLNSVKQARDGWIIKAPPLTSRRIVFFVNGAMLYLDLQIDEQPEGTELPKLRQMYDQVYEKSGLRKEGERLAELIRKKNFRHIWKNQDTVDYLLKIHPEKES